MRAWERSGTCALCINFSVTACIGVFLLVVRSFVQASLDVGTFLVAGHMLGHK